jgi:antitoxin component YwqK of YwqJK toxin-antitoxin module
MRCLFTLLFTILLLSVQSQTWKSYIISVRGDTLNRVDMDDKKQGPWVHKYASVRGEPGYEEQGYYENDMKVGRWVKFSLMGDKLAEENYRWGQLDGKSRYYTRLGGLVREESWRAVEPGKKFDTVDVIDPMDASRIIERAIVPVEGYAVKHGTWTYYDPEWGTILRTEEYWMNKSKAEIEKETAGVGDDLKPLDVSKDGNAEKKEVKKPQAILDFEKKNSGKKKVKVRDGRTGGG